MEGAGHHVGGAPYLPHGTNLEHPVLQASLATGGTRAANESALRRGWAKVLVLLESLTR